MIHRIYIRIAKTGEGKFKADASMKPSKIPLHTAAYNGKTFHPTICFAVDTNILDEAFDEANVPIGQAGIVLGHNATIATDVPENSSL